MSRFGFGGDVSADAPLATTALRASFEEWLRWGLLEAGAWAVSAPGRLRPAADPNYPAPTGTARCWESDRPGWPWETGAGVPAVTGAVVGGTPTPTGFAVDYIAGRLVFAAALPTGTVVTCAHPYRTHHVHRDDEPWVSAVDLAGDPAFDAAQGGRGRREALAAARVRLPAWVVGPAGTTTAAYEMGSDRVHWDGAFRVVCLAETPWERDWLADALTRQADRAVPAFDPAAAPRPLNPDGTLAALLTWEGWAGQWGGQSTPWGDPLYRPEFGGVPPTGVALPAAYPELCETHPWRPVRVRSAVAGPPARTGPLHWAVVRVVLRAACP